MLYVRSSSSALTSEAPNSKRASRAARRTLKTSLTCVVTLLLAVAASGCAPVAPYERGKLAHPTMSAGDISSMGEGHLRAISEGATGGSGGTGSGCGCN
jgi:hypothetical protein